MSRILLLVIMCVLPFIVSGSDTLTIKKFQELVLLHHPLIKSANLYDQIGDAYLLKAKGALDPKILADYDGKQFKSTDYFQRWNGEIKLPTKYPVDVSLGYENNDGQFINNDEILPNNGLMYGTISISVLRGLLFDTERFLLKESELLQSKSEIEKKIIVRDILIEGIRAYLDWAAAYKEVEILSAFNDRVAERHELVKELYVNGDKPAIDTIESRINLNTAMKDLLSSEEKLLWKRQKLSMFLWDDGGEPLMLLDGVSPQSLNQIVDFLQEEGKLRNPDWKNDLMIRKKENQIQQLSLENRLEKEQLKPQLDVKLNTIHGLGDNGLAYSYSPRDYKVGASLAVPIRNRKTRGQLRLNNAIIDQTILEQTYYISGLQYKYNALIDNQAIKNQSILIVEEKLLNMNTLNDAEQLKFNLGESSVFLLNSRERKLLETQLDYVKTMKSLGYILNEIIFLKIGQS